MSDVDDMVESGSKADMWQKQVESRLQSILARMDNAGEVVTDHRRNSTNVWSAKYTDQGTGGAAGAWWKVTGIGTTIATFTTGFGCNGTAIKQVTADAGGTLSGFSVDGEYVLRAKYEYGTDTWSVDSVAYVDDILGDSWDAGDDDTQTWALAKITVVSSLISTIVQMHPTEQAVLYESRI